MPIFIPLFHNALPSNFTFTFPFTPQRPSTVASTPADTRILSARRVVEHPVYPPPAYDSTSVSRAREDVLARFFGAHYPAAPSSSVSSSETAPPPAYTYHKKQRIMSDVESLPGYYSGTSDDDDDDDEEEPNTLAKYMFTYGFLFPPFWLVGVVILLSPLRAPSDWVMRKSDEDSVRILARIRAAEIRWGMRCLSALGVLLAVAALVALVVFIFRDR